MAEISPGRRCAAKYPIVLIHGAGFRDLKWPLYWGRIPGALEKNGALVRYGLQDSWGSIESNAQMIARRIDEILDRLFGLPRGVFRLAALAVDNWIRVVGDKKPDFLRVCEDFTTERMERFNRENPDAPGVWYQSFACVMSHPLSDANLSTANFVLNRIEGPNDGLVSVESALWGENARVLRSGVFRGISHLDAIDLRRAPLTRRSGDGVRDICEVYLQIAEDLKNRGF